MPNLGPAGRGGARRRTRRRMSRRMAVAESASTQSQAEATEAPATPAASESDEPSYLDELEKLGELRDKGVITSEDFEAKKKQLLGI